MDGLVKLSADWLLILPDIALLILLAIVMLVDLFIGLKHKKVTENTTLFGLLLVFLCQLGITIMQMGKAKPLFAFNHMIISDGLANISRLCILIMTMVVLIYSRQYLKQHHLYRGEYYLLTLFALLGINCMVSSMNYVLLFVGLELLSLALYALIALQKDSQLATEAALKYFVLGSLASGIFLFGVSLIYGAAHSLDLTSTIDLIMNEGQRILSLLGIVFMLVGIAFKFGSVPFHMWVPDVYEGAPTCVTLWIGSVPKIAISLFAVRILTQSMHAYWADWSIMLQLLAMLSLLLGNIAAVLQSNIKRMLAYSTIAHMGFVLLGLSLPYFGAEQIMHGLNKQGLNSALFYVLTYVFTVSVAFGVLMAVSYKNKECTNLSDLAGLNERHPILAGMMLLSMFSLAGIPPLLGFYAKLYVIEVLISAHWTALAVFAIMMSLVGAFYYLRVVKVMYFDTTHEKQAESLALDFSLSAKILLTINGLALLVLGCFPSILIKLCQYMVSFSRLLE